MELRDLIVAPIVILLVYIGAYIIRPYFTDDTNKRYFLPALTMKMAGAIALGLVYQYYYGWGDTYNYHSNGSRIVWEAFTDDSLSTVARLIFGSTDNETGMYKYTSRILFYKDPNAYFIVRIASLFDLFTFSSYAGTAVLFSVFSFIGSWMMFLVFYRQYSHLHYGLALATLFIPSSFFWGSGILKDTVIIGSLGIATYHLYVLFFERRFSLISIVMLLVALFIILQVRIFVLQAYLPAVILWIIAYRFNQVRSVILRIMAAPFLAMVLLVSTFFVVAKVGEDDKKYSVSNLAKTSRVTAYDIGFYTGGGAGSSYSLDVSDWTPLGMLQSAPAAVNVSLFRPYLWEVRNPLMLISAVESTVIFILFLYVVANSFKRIPSALTDHNILFLLAFSLIFSFAIGISTFNFGTLSRYRIPSLTFFTLALVLINNHSNSERKLDSLEVTE